MNQTQEPDDSKSESLADVPPTSVDPANALPARDLALGAIVLTVAGAGTILLIGATMTPTMGATRSTRLEWERRTLQIEEAERNLQLKAELDAQIDVQSEAQSKIPPGE
jgi:hypothetical protein